MRKVFNSGIDVFRIYKSELLPDTRRTEIVKKAKFSNVPEEEGMAFAQILSAKMGALP